MLEVRYQNKTNESQGAGEFAINCGFTLYKDIFCLLITEEFFPYAKKGITMELATDSESYQDAVRKVKNLKAFYYHLGSFIFVNAILITINLLTSPGHLWFYWVTIFWGIVLVWNAVQVYSYQKNLGKNWEERKIREYMEKK
jgi:hypothetical protein